MGVDQLPLMSFGGWLLDDLTNQGSEPASASRHDREEGLFGQLPLGNA